MPIDKYLDQLTNLQTSKRKGQIAPHKAVMLLSVIDLIENSEIRQNTFDLSHSLENRFMEYWDTYVGSSDIFRPAPATPFYHLCGEPFWSLIDKHGNDIGKLPTTPSVSYLRGNGICAVIDDELFGILKTKSGRKHICKLLVSTYLSTRNTQHSIAATKTAAKESSDRYESEISALHKVIKEQEGQIDKMLSDNKSLVKGLNLQETLLVNSVNDFKANIAQRDKEIVRHKATIKRLKKTISTLQKSLIAQRLQQPIPKISSGLDEFKFLRMLNDEELPELPDDFKRIKYVYSGQDEVHFEIMYPNIHDDEGKLSKLRVRLYEQFQAAPDKPLLVCSCCGRPIFLSGNAGIKGEIMGFRHLGEINARTGEHIGENITPPKQENVEELEFLRNAFLSYETSMDDFSISDSFVMLPGSDRRKYIGDITFSYGNEKIAILFVSAGHPLDFIIRRVKAAHERGYLPLWILSESYFYSNVLSNRDISVFSNGYISTIDNDAISASYQAGEPCLLARDYYKNAYTIVRLSAVISDARSTLHDLMSRPEWDSADKPKRPRIATSNQVLPTTRKAVPQATTSTAQSKRKKTISITDFWAGRRINIKGKLFLDRMDSGFGILNMETQRYLALPIFERIEISEDKTEASLFLKGEEYQTIKI